MYATNFSRAANLADASAKMGAATDGKYLAGGQTLIPTMKQRLAAPSDLIDLTRIPDLSGIKADADTVTIGAATRHYDVATSATVRGAIPAIAALAAGIGDPAVRHMGTIGGSIANNDPAADYPAAVLALGAGIITDKRTIFAEAWFQGLFSTALGTDEIVKAIQFPIPAKAAYAKFPNPASRYALAGVFVAKMKNGSVRVAATGVGEGGVLRFPALEAALQANWSAAAIANVAVSPEGLLSDIHGSAEYRANLINVMARRAVAAAG
ncbi:FAD binding domain-containing protein [Prosthecodimorpha staleyi]|uniref:FAD binding domain-containing protein n=1 Tax=Prosthecodimorpha staleyi TaxID=2840188 RepID=A0A947D7I4_9HYPH|nr:FAD binding domain-containing protein [Prosthecodimorpha staleyi]MBT9291803.1 FAD binding domain-containing protein [Prosthecodimorpha staleyi]